jgi:hypothetical protein
MTWIEDNKNYDVINFKILYMMMMMMKLLCNITRPVDIKDKRHRTREPACG